MFADEGETIELHGFGDAAAQALACERGADWVGASDEPSRQLVCTGIHIVDIPSCPYNDLWGKRRFVSVSNLTRQDAHDFLQIAPKIGLRLRTTLHSLREANQAPDDLRSGRLQGATVLQPRLFAQTGRARGEDTRILTTIKRRPTAAY